MTDTPTPPSDSNRWSLAMTIYAPGGSMRPLTEGVKRRLEEHLQATLGMWIQQDAMVRDIDLSDQQGTSEELARAYAWAHKRGVLKSYRIRISPLKLEQEWQEWSEQERDWFELIAEDFGHPNWVARLRAGDLLHYYPYYLM